MAELDPYAPQEGQGNYLGYSKGVIPDEGLASLFSNSAKILTGGVKVISDWMQEEARQDYTRSHDEITGVFTGTRDPRMMSLGNEPYRAGPGADRARTPQELRDYEERLAGLKDAYSSGKLQGSHYWAMLDMEARRVRARFPGFREEIDKMVSQVSGAIPANRLVQELEREAQARGQESRASREYWLRQATELGVAGDVEARAAAGRPISDQEFQQRVNVARAQMAGRQRRAQDMADRKARGEQIEVDAAREANQTLLEIQAGVLDRAASGVGLELRRVQETLLDIQGQGHGASTPDQLNTLREHFNNTVLQPLEAAARHEMYRTRAGGLSYAQMINDPAKVESIVKNAMGQMSSISNYLGKGDWSAIGVIANNLDSINKGDQLAVLQSNAALRDLQVATAIAGNQFVMSSAFTSTPMKSELNSLLKRHLTGIMAGRDWSLDRLHQEAAAQHNYDPQYTWYLINKGTSIIVNDKAPIETLERFVRAHFGRGNSDFLNHVTNKAEVYNMMVSDPRVAANMQRIAQRNPELYQEYRQWVVRNFEHAMGETARTAQGIITGGRGEISFSAATNSFVYTGNNINARNTVSSMNKTLAGVYSMIKADGKVTPEDAHTIVTDLIGKLNINTAASSQGTPVQNLWDTARFALQSVAANNPNTNRPQTVEPRNAASILNFIGGGESGEHGYHQGFSRTPGPNGSLRSERYTDLTSMSLGEVQGLQGEIIRGQRTGGVPEGTASSAIGKYQFTQKAFNDTIKEMGLPLDTKFSPDVQDAMAMHQLNKMGFQEYIQGKLKVEDLMDRMAGYWAALPKANGQPGITTGQNRPNRNVAEFRAVLEDLKRKYGNSRG